MDVLTDHPFPTGFDPTDDLCIGTDTLEFDLEKFINDDSVCLPEEAIPAVAYSHPHTAGNGFRINNIHLRGIPAPQPLSQPQICPPQSQPNTTYCSQQQQQHAQAQQQQQAHAQQQQAHAQQQQQQMRNINMAAYIDNSHMLHTTLPDSPPDSEPYSPPDDRHPNNHQDSSKYPLTSTSNAMHPHMYPHHRPPNHIPSPKTVITMPGYHEPPHLNHLPPTTHHPPIPSLPPQPAVGLNPQLLSPGNLSPQSKKRKHIPVDSPESAMTGALFNGRTGLLSTIKQEPAGGYTNTTYLPDCDDDYSSYDPDSSNGYIDGVYQVIKWQPYQVNKWATLTDLNLKDLPAPQYRVDADKGFNLSGSDESFVVQKKNHFQVTCHINIQGDPKYIRTPDGVKKIDRYCLHFRGIKMEAQNQSIKIEQSQSDRSKKAFNPVRIEIAPDQVSKLTVGRLHFSETTSNNMRKKGRPNPDQRYFMLVVALHVHSGEGDYMIASSASEKIIVRASNPGQFDNEMDVLHWQRGHTQDSVYHMGRVGVNTDHPDEAVTVHGNVKLSGQILHTSDIRAKENLKEVDSKKQLKKVSEMKIYDYNFSEDYADHVGMPENKRKDTGVIAQELREVLPDAVRETGDVKFDNGNEIKSLLVVNKDRIFMENVGAVKELCKLTDNLEVRIDELEKMNTKLSKLKRYDSLKSTVSSKSTCSNVTSVSNSVPKKSPRAPRVVKQPTPRPPPKSWCSNRFIQITIIILICIMAFCLIAITILYILERQKEDNHTTVVNLHVPHGTNSSPTMPPNTTTEKPTTVSIVIPPVTTTKQTPHELVIIQANCSVSQCTTMCCGPVNSDQPENGDHVLQSYIDFLHEIFERKKKAQQPPYHVNPDEGSGAGSGDGSGMPPTTPKIQVIINDNGQYVDNNSGRNSEYNYGKRRKRSLAEPDFKAVISLVESNFTLTDENLEPRFSMTNNRTYNLPYSSDFGYEQYTLRFSVGAYQRVHLCHHELAQQCSGTTYTEEGWSDRGLEWKMRIGKFKSSFFRFRVTRLDNDNVCMQPGEESNGMYTEYNLHFARICHRGD